MKKILKGAIAGTVLLLAPFTQAAMVTNWDYEVTLEWTNAVFEQVGGGTAGITEGGALLSWGATNGSMAVPNGNRSGLRITSSGNPGSIETTLDAINDPKFGLTHLITHYNNVLDASFRTLLSATLKTTLKLTPTSPSGPALPTLEKTFDINFTETSNTSTVAGCDFAQLEPDPVPCDDIFVISLGALNEEFEYDGYKYFVSIVETLNSFFGLSNEACSVAGAGAGCLGFQTKERTSTPAQFAFIITTEPVNVVAAPGVLALMGLGLVALVGVRRRKQLVA